MHKICKSYVARQIHVRGSRVTVPLNSRASLKLYKILCSIKVKLYSSLNYFYKSEFVIFILFADMNISFYFLNGPIIFFQYFVLVQAITNTTTALALKKDVHLRIKNELSRYI